MFKRINAAYEALGRPGGGAAAAAPVPAPTPAPAAAATAARGDAARPQQPAKPPVRQWLNEELVKLEAAEKRAEAAEKEVEAANQRAEAADKEVEELSQRLLVTQADLEAMRTEQSAHASPPVSPAQDPPGVQETVNDGKEAPSAILQLGIQARG